MADILVSRAVSEAELATMFRATLPQLLTCLVSSEDVEALVGPKRPESSGLLLLGANDVPYPLGISVWDMPETLNDPVLTALARHLSDHLACDAVCDGAPYGDGIHPCFSLLWRDGKPG